MFFRIQIIILLDILPLPANMQRMLAEADCIHSFIYYGDLYSASSRLLLRSPPDPCTAKKKSFEARVECVRKNLGSNHCAKGSPFHTEGQPPRMHRPGRWRYEQKEQRVTPVAMSGVSCDLWCPGWDSKDLGGRPEQNPGYASRPGHQYGISSAAGETASGVHQACRQIRVQFKECLL